MIVKRDTHDIFAARVDVIPTENPMRIIQKKEERVFIKKVIRKLYHIYRLNSKLFG